MRQLKKDLQTLSKEFDALTKKTKQLTNMVRTKANEQLKKAQATVTPEIAARKTADALKSLTRTMERMTKSVEKFEREQISRKRKTKAKSKAKPVRRTPAKKKAPTATDQVLKIIKRSKKGVDVPTLAKKTGFEDKKVRGIVYRAVKQGKIKRAGRGLYAGA
jgi:hypothetical protein